jgi:hypothetical protein
LDYNVPLDEEHGGIDVARYFMKIRNPNRDDIELFKRVLSRLSLQQLRQLEDSKYRRSLDLVQEEINRRKSRIKAVSSIWHQ